ncbi:MAG: hypothetical protein AAGJ79_01655 [Verrucomicrobiota bacterium]
MSLFRALSAAVTAAFAIPYSGLAALAPSNVLVVYNSPSAGSTAVKDHYVAARPGVEVLDLNDAGLAVAQVNYADFESKIRDPIRSHLTNNNLLNSIYVIVLAKGIPHRIFDLTSATVGDSPSSVSIPNYTAASVDTELTLLYSDLDSGEAGADEDSNADSYVSNPYFGQSASITNLGRGNVDDPLAFRIRTDIFGVRHWQPGRLQGQFQIFIPEDASRIYLVARLDGNSVSDVTAMIDRGLNPVYDTSRNAAVFDRDQRATQFDNGDYDAAVSELSTWSNVTNNTTNTFFIGRTGGVAESNVSRETAPVAWLAGYGFNHNGGSFIGYQNTFGDQLVPGAIFNTYESYNGRDFGGLGGRFNHGQISTWIANGGTFATGNVWEPFTLGVVLNDDIAEQFINGSLTWIEAAYSGLRTLSWQGVIVGDPLATATLTTSAFEQWQITHFGSSSSPDAIATADPDGDGKENVLEYALGTNPNSADHGSCFTIFSTGTGGTKTISFETVRNTNRDDVTLVFEGSTDLLTWNPLPAVVVSTDQHLETIRYDTTVSAEARLYTKLTATLQ